MHIEGDIVVSIKHVARRGKNVAKMVTCLMETVIHPIICMLETWFIYMPHGNNYVSLKMHDRDMVCIPIDSH